MPARLYLAPGLDENGQRSKAPAKRQDWARSLRPEVELVEEGADAVLPPPLPTWGREQRRGQ